MSHEAIILPTSRSIRAEIIRSQERTLFLPNYLTIAEFIERACLVEGFIKPDNDTRILLLLEAANFQKFENLKIERNFFTFLQNSGYFFTFFTELAGEKIEISSLQTADTYAEYEEHLSILSTLYTNYELLCKKHHVLDPIFLSKWYRLNSEYIRSLENIKIIVEGYLTAFEVEFFTQCCSFAMLTLYVTTTNFNHKMLQRFSLLGFTLQSGYRYILNLNDKKIVSVEKSVEQIKTECFGFKERVLQVAFIKKKVYEYIDAGLALQDIAVVLPDESFAPLLRLYDTERNFNFAMGESFVTTSAYQHFDAVCRYIEDSNEQNRARVLRYGIDLYERLVHIYYKKMEEVDFKELIQSYSTTLLSKAHAQIIDEELYKFLKLQNIYKKYNLKSTLHLFLERLSQRTLDDVGGGQITVMGLLETRYMHFKGVIIVDFDDLNVPKRSQKDLFLNSDIRLKADLPTQQDREDLQKHYYSLLLNRAMYVSIAYTQDSTPSRFLTQLGIPIVESEHQKRYALLLHEKYHLPKIDMDTDIEVDYDFTKQPVSASSLKTFLECKRKYYNRYLLRIRDHVIPQDLPQEYEIGQDLHNIFKNLYLKKNSFQTKDELEYVIYKELDSLPVGNSFERYQLRLWKQKLTGFVQNEIKRFQNGYSVKECEVSLSCKHERLTLAGQIDRIDICDEGIYILDYKSGKYPVYTSKTVQKATDFQLEFYYLLSLSLDYDIQGCGYYDLGSGQVIDEVLLFEKLEILTQHLRELQETKRFVFDKTEDQSRCRYCEYILMCGRA